MPAELNRNTGWRWRWQRVTAIMRMECMQLLRDRSTLGMIVLVPVIQLALFAGTVNLNPASLRLVIAYAAGANTELAVQAARATGGFSVITLRPVPGAARAAAANGIADIGLELRAVATPTALVAPAASAPSAASATSAIYADAADATAVRPATMALAVELQRSAALELANELGISPELVQQNNTQIEWLNNPQALTSWSITPGLIGAVIMISMLLLGALTLVRERELGQWESLLATAADGTDVIIGKLTPYVLLGTLQALIIAGCAHWLFDVPIRGPLSVLAIAAALLAVAHLLLGFALSTLASTQLQAVQSVVFFYLPSMLLSGFMFPFQGMPRWAQWLGEGLPLTHFVRIARDVMLRGAGGQFLNTELGPIAAFAAVAAFIALRGYRRHLS